MTLLHDWRRDLLASTLPWLIYHLGLTAGCPVWGAGLASVGWGVARGSTWRETKVFELAILAFFATAALAPDHPLASRAGIMIPLLLSLMAFGSTLLGQPCTLQYARLMVGPEWWQNRHFIAVNRVLTLLWGACFLLSAGLSLESAGLSQLPRLGLGGLQIGLYAGALWYTRCYPRWYRLHHYLPLVRAGREPYLKPPPKRR